MTNAASIQIGRVVTGGKVHLIANGSTRCPVVAHRNITAYTKPSSVTPETICGHCNRNANLTAVERANTMGRTSSAAIDAMLSRLATPAMRARSAELVARYHAAHPIVAPQPSEPVGLLALIEPVAPVHELSAFGRIKAAHEAARQLQTAA